MSADKKIIWVTGACGFTGVHLIRYIKSLQQPVYVIALDIIDADESEADEYRNLDLGNFQQIMDLVRQSPPHWIFHLAGVLPPADEVQMWNANVGGTYNLINALFHTGCKETRILSIGSAAEYLPTASGYYSETSATGGLSPHGRTKTAQSLLALAAGKNAGIDVIIARTFNLTGPGLSRKLVVGEICAQLAEGKTSLSLGDIEAKRDFLDIRDAVMAYWKLIEKGQPGEVYNVCSGNARSIKEMIDIAVRTLDVHVEIHTDKSSRKNDFDVSYGDPSKTEALIGKMTFISCEDSVQDMMKRLNLKKEGK